MLAAGTGFIAKEYFEVDLVVSSVVGQFNWGIVKRWAGLFN